MPPPPPPTLPPLGVITKLEKESSVTTLSNEKNKLAASTSLREKRSMLLSGGTLTRPLGVSLRETEGKTRRKGQAIARTTVPSFSSTAKSNLAPEGQSRLSPNLSRTLAATPTGPSKTFTASSTSPDSVRALSSPHPTAELASMFDGVPFQGCLEYLTRPHRSWDSALRIRELRGRRLELGGSRLAGGRGSSHSTATSGRLSCASLSRTTSASGFSVRTAPPTTGGPSGAFARIRRTGSGSLRRGRLGALPSFQPELEGLALSGNPLLLSRFNSLSLSQKSSPNTEMTHNSAGAERSGMGASSVRRIHEFMFKMQ